MSDLDIVRKSVKIPPKIRFQPPKINLPGLPWKIVFSTFLIFAILVAGAFIFLPSAVIVVKARSEPVARDFEITLDKNLAAASSADLAMPAQIMEREVGGTKKFPSTGSRNAGKIASGFISIYNFSKTTLILKQQTTELTANGRKYYFTQDAANIRPTARIGLEDEEIDETSLVPPIPVVGAGPGEEYNLKAGTRLEIRNDAFGSQPKLLYAVAAEDVSGGTTNLVKFVTQNDIDSAAAVLAQVLSEQAKDELKSENPGLRIEGAATQMEILERQSEYQAGREVPEFFLTVRIKMHALTYDEDDMRSIIYDRVSRLLPKEKRLSEQEVSIVATPVSLSLAEGRGVLQVHFEGEIVYTIDVTELAGRVRGKSAEEIREIFLSRPEIEHLDVEFSPFWVKSAPKFTSRIRLDVR